MGGLVGQPQLARSAGCCSRATTTATSPREGRATPDDADGGRAASRRSRAAAPGCIARRARRRSALPAPWAGAAAPSRGARGRARSTATLDRRWRRTSYSDITAGRARARGWRASPRSARRRPTSREPAAPPAAAPATPTTALRAVPSLLADMPVGVQRRHVRAPRARGDRLRRAGPRRRARRAGRRGAGAAAASTSATRPRSSPGCARRSRRRSARWSAGCGCATSRAPTGSTSSTSSCRSPAATTPTGRARRSARSPTCCARTSAGDPLAGYADAARRPRAAPAVRGYLTGSIDLVAAAAGRRASRSSTTRRTGSPRPARR